MLVHTDVIVFLSLGGRLVAEPAEPPLYLGLAVRDNAVRAE
jgi:hypothetical protein